MAYQVRRCAGTAGDDSDIGMPCLSFVDSWAWMPRMKKYVSGLIGIVCLASLCCSRQGGLVSWLFEGGIVPT